MSALKGIVAGKCPKCEEGKIFRTNGNPVLFKIPVMNDNCPVCGHKFEKEPGYFYGAMYVSYAVTVAQMLLIFLVAFQFTNNLAIIFASVVVFVFALSTINYKLSRILWIYMFDGKNRNNG